MKYWKAQRNSGTKHVVTGKLIKDVVNLVKIKSDKQKFNETIGIMSHFSEFFIQKKLKNLFKATKIISVAD